MAVKVSSHPSPLLHSKLLLKVSSAVLSFLESESTTSLALDSIQPWSRYTAPVCLGGVVEADISNIVFRTETRCTDKMYFYIILQLPLLQLGN